MCSWCVFYAAGIVFCAAGVVFYAAGVVFHAAGVSFMQLLCLLCSCCVFCAADVVFYEAGVAFCAAGVVFCAAGVVFCAGSVSPLYVSLRPEGPSTAELVDRRFQMFPHDPVFPMIFFFWKHKLSIRYDFFSSHI